MYNILNAYKYNILYNISYVQQMANITEVKH